MTSFALIEALVCAVALLVLIPVSVLFVQVVMALPRYPLRDTQTTPRPSTAVLVPAHNEAVGLAGTVRSITPQLTASDRLIVVADNCTDDTARIAAEAGAEVLERTDGEHRGKGFALDFGIRHLERHPTQAVLVLDADCRIDSGAVERLARRCIETGRPVQGLDLMLSPSDAPLETRVMEFAWLVKNHVRALGFYRLGLPCQLMGTGMAFPWTVIRSTSLASANIVEDIELGIDLARTGSAPLFCPEARVTSYFPRTPAQIASQRTRWEHGHLRMILRTGPRAFVEALRRRDCNLFALALDLSVPPLALLTLLVLSVFVASAIVAMPCGFLLPLWLSALSFVMLVSAVLLSWTRYGRHVISFTDLASGPLYALSKLPLYLKFLVKPQREWVRAIRDRS